ncbi:MAG TPA: dihydroorotate dehydrogenase-like protein [Anaerolineae bacterium]|nr:dihydroorotate dehydrogenase-like protein [Anaerolineae bacterium]
MNLTTHYMGFTLKNPIVPSASPLTRNIDNIRRMEDAGAAAITLYSLFEEQIEFEAEQFDHFFGYGTDSFAEALSYFPKQGEFPLGPDQYLEHVRQAKQAVDIPVIASLNGVSDGGWIDYATKIQQAGADALEVNLYFLPTDPRIACGEVEQIYLDVLLNVRRHVDIPVAMKIGPYFSAMPRVAHGLDAAGADALVLFNRFYQPDLDIEELTVGPHLVLSTSDELRLPMRWIAILYGHVDCSLALTSGVHTVEDAVKAVMAGADIANTTSALLKHGIGHITTLVDGFARWMEEHEYDSVDMMKGSLSQRNVAEPAAFERANYMRTLQSYKGLP